MFQFSEASQLGAEGALVALLRTAGSRPEVAGPAFRALVAVARAHKEASSAHLCALFGAADGPLLRRSAAAALADAAQPLGSEPPQRARRWSRDEDDAEIMHEDADDADTNLDTPGTASLALEVLALLRHLSPAGVCDADDARLLWAPARKLLRYRPRAMDAASAQQPPMSEVLAVLRLVVTVPTRDAFSCGEALRALHHLLVPRWRAGRPERAARVAARAVAAAAGAGVAEDASRAFAVVLDRRTADCAPGHMMTSSYMYRVNTWSIADGVLVALARSAPDDANDYDGEDPELASDAENDLDVTAFAGRARGVAPQPAARAAVIAACVARLSETLDELEGMKGTKYSSYPSSDEWYDRVYPWLCVLAVLMGRGGRKGTDNADDHDAPVALVLGGAVEAVLRVLESPRPQCENALCDHMAAGLLRMLFWRCSTDVRRALLQHPRMRVAEVLRAAESRLRAAEEAELRHHHKAEHAKARTEVVDALDALNSS